MTFFFWSKIPKTGGFLKEMQEYENKLKGLMDEGKENEGIQGKEN